MLIAQNGDKYRDVKECAVSELPALADETVVSVPAAVVVAVTTKGFVVSDERMTDNVFVADAAKVAVGDKVSIKGTKSSDAQKLPTVTDCDQVKVLSSGGAVAYPTPTDLSAAIDSYTSDRRGYVAVTGFFDGSTVAVAETSKYSVSVVDAPPALGLAALAGHNVTVTGYYAGLAEPVHRIMATAVEDEGAVEVIYFSDDFEWMDEWSVASNAGRTVETDDLKAECPRVTTNAALKAPFLTDLEENHGYKLIYGNNDKKGPNTPDGIYLQRNYFKFGKTGYQAGHRPSPDRRHPRRRAAHPLVRLVSDAAGRRQGRCDRSGQPDRRRRPTAGRRRPSRFPRRAGRPVISSNGFGPRSHSATSSSTRIRRSPSSRRNGPCRRRTAGSSTTSRSSRLRRPRSQHVNHIGRRLHSSNLPADAPFAVAPVPFAAAAGDFASHKR